MLVVGIEEKLPLADLIEAWAMDERGVQRGRLLRLASLLGSGMPPDDAIEEIPGVLHDRDLLAFRFDLQSGTRTAAMRSLLDNAALPAADQRGGASAGFFLVYLGFVLPVALALTAFLQLNIVPVFAKMLYDFSVPPPDVFIGSQRFGAALARYGPPVLLLGLAVVWFLIATRAGLRLTRFLSGWVLNPSRDAYTGDVLQMLAVSSGSGRPLSGALSTLARYHFDPVLRQRLLFARNEVEQGIDVWQSLAAAGLLTREQSHAIGTGQRLGNQPWVLAQLAGVKQRLARRRWNAVVAFLWPLVILALGAFVLFQGLALFVPLLEILRVVSGQ
jgi:type II secretory pathway component PulF